MPTQSLYILSILFEKPVYETVPPWPDGQSQVVEIVTIHYREYEEMKEFAPIEFCEEHQVAGRGHRGRFLSFKPAPADDELKPGMMRRRPFLGPAFPHVLRPMADIVASVNKQLLDFHNLMVDAQAIKAKRPDENRGVPDNVQFWFDDYKNVFLGEG